MSQINDRPLDLIRLSLDFSDAVLLHRSFHSKLQDKDCKVESYELFKEMKSFHSKLAIFCRITMQGKSLPTPFLRVSVRTSKQVM